MRPAACTVAWDAPARPTRRPRPARDGRPLRPSRGRRPRSQGSSAAATFWANLSAWRRRRRPRAAFWTRRRRPRRWTSRPRPRPRRRRRSVACWSAGPVPAGTARPRSVPTGIRRRTGNPFLWRVKKKKNDDHTNCYNDLLLNWRVWFLSFLSFTRINNAQEFGTTRTRKAKRPGLVICSRKQFCVRLPDYYVARRCKTR